MSGKWVNLTQSIIDKYLEKFDIPECIVCKSRDNTIDGYTRGIQVFKNELEMSDTLRCVVSKCNNCGHLEFFSADIFVEQ